MGQTKIVSPPTASLAAARPAAADSASAKAFANIFAAAKPPEATPATGWAKAAGSWGKKQAPAPGPEAAFREVMAKFIPAGKSQLDETGVRGALQELRQNRGQATTPAALALADGYEKFLLKILDAIPRPPITRSDFPMLASVPGPKADATAVRAAYTEALSFADSKYPLSAETALKAIVEGRFVKPGEDILKLSSAGARKALTELMANKDLIGTDTEKVAAFKNVAESLQWISDNGPLYKAYADHGRGENGAVPLVLWALGSALQGGLR